MARLVHCAVLLLLLLICIHGALSQGLGISFPNGNTVAERDGYITICVDLSTASNEEISITFSTQLSAGAGRASDSDLQLVTNEILTFESGELQQCTNVTIEMDDIIEPDETFTVVVVDMNVPPNVITSTVDIIDSNVLTISFTEPSFTVEDEQSSVMVCATIVDGTIMPGKTIEADLVLRSESATAGVDFEVSVLNFVFSSSVSLSCVSVNITEDTLIEDTEQFLAVVPRTPSNTQLQIINNSAVIIIQDNDMATVRLLTTELTILEGNFSNTTFREVCIELIDMQEGLDRCVEINVTSMSMTATEGVDFVRVSETLVFEEGAETGAVRCFNITIIGDNIIESGENETFTVEAVANTPDIIQGPTTINITIQGDGDANICGILTLPNNGELIITGNNVGDTATYDCIATYRLVGDSPRTCQAAQVGESNGRWTGEEPVCLAICESLMIQNGFVVDSTRLEGDIATYGCNADYRLVGNVNRVCQEDGTWNGSDATCQLFLCETLRDPANGAVQHDVPPVIGVVATYSCNSPFSLVGEETRSCSSMGEWSGDAPSCDGALGLQSVSLMVLLMCAVAALLSQAL